MSEMPTLGRSTRPRRRARVAAAVIILSGAGVASWRFARRDRPAAPVPAPAPVAVTDAGPALDGPPPPAAAAVPDDPLKREGMRYARATVAGPLETAFVAQVGRDLGEPLTQVVTRTLVWWVAVPQDLRRGDVVETLFSERQGAEPLVHAVRFQSGKNARAFEAYRFQATGSAFPRFFTRDGQELELRLKSSPLDNHEQVTSLIRDGRGHRGIDLRTPVGTPVKATFDAVVVRKNWSFQSNGNCIELREQGGAGRSAYFLHLSEVLPELGPGSRVARGQVIARSGNTGHSFAPHLHYQLMSPSGEVLDPFAVEPTVRRALPDGDRARFDAEVQRLEGLLARGAESAAAAAPDAGR